MYVSRKKLFSTAVLLAAVAVAPGNINGQPGQGGPPPGGSRPPQQGGGGGQRPPQGSGGQRPPQQGGGQRPGQGGQRPPQQGGQRPGQGNQRPPQNGGRPPQGNQRPPQVRPPQQGRPNFQFDPGRRNQFLQHYRTDAMRWRGRRRPPFVPGYVIPHTYYIRPVPSSYWAGMPPPPPGYMYGYYDGYVVAYNPTTRIIADVMDLVSALM